MGKLAVKIKFFLLFVSFFGFAQKPVKVKGIKGSSFISGDVSPNMAKQQALNDAKTAALKEAGVSEHINSYQMLFTSHAKNDYSQFFSSDIQSEIQGVVSTYSLLSEKTWCKSEKEIVTEVVIDAEVIKYDTKPDPGFTFEVDGIKAVYNNGDNLHFEVRTSQGGYLHIFNITDAEAGLLFPNGYEKQNLLAKMTPVRFPMAEIDYTVGNEKKKDETNRLIFVLTKTDIPFMKAGKDLTCTNESIFNWIYAIPPDQRRVLYFSVSILR